MIFSLFLILYTETQARAFHPVGGGRQRDSCFVFQLQGGQSPVTLQYVKNKKRKKEEEEEKLEKEG